MSSNMSKAETHDRIVDAALDLFAEKGFGAVSVQSISGQAGVAHGTVFWHFGSKKDLYIATAKYAGRLLRETLEPLARSARGASGAKELLVAEYEFFKKKPAIWRLCLATAQDSLGAYPELVRAVAFLNHEMGEIWRIWTRNAEREGLLQPGTSAADTARLINATFSGLLTVAELREIDITPDLEHFARVLQAGCLVSPRTEASARLQAV